MKRDILAHRGGKSLFWPTRMRALTSLIRSSACSNWSNSRRVVSSRVLARFSSSNWLARSMVACDGRNSRIVFGDGAEANRVAISSNRDDTDGAVDMITTSVGQTEHSTGFRDKGAYVAVPWMPHFGIPRDDSQTLWSQSLAVLSTDPNSVNRDVPVNSESKRDFFVLVRVPSGK
jgi:hypothetical protein